MTERVRVGTRGSPLALRQADLVAAALRRAWPGLEVELTTIRTTGDRLATAHLADVGGKGLFVHEIDEALLGGRIDIAVHSLKDLPADRPAGLVLGACPERADPRDVLVSRGGGTLGALPRGARLGTSSLRRQVQILARRPDIVVEPIRGNVDTRLRRLEDGEYDAIMLAAAGLARLGLRPPGGVPLDPGEMLPAAGQGTLAVEVREGDDRTRRLAAPLDHVATRAATTAERSFLAALGGACTTPLAAYARITPGGLRLDAFLATPDGTRVLTDGDLDDLDDPAGLGRRVAERMLEHGAAEIVRTGQPA